MSREQLEAAIRRPPDYARMGPADQWQADKGLGILGWCPTHEEAEEYIRRRNEVLTRWEAGDASGLLGEAPRMCRFHGLGVRVDRMGGCLASKDDGSQCEEPATGPYAELAAKLTLELDAVKARLQKMFPGIEFPQGIETAMAGAICGLQARAETADAKVQRLEQGLEGVLAQLYEGPAIQGAVKTCEEAEKMVADLLGLRNGRA